MSNLRVTSPRSKSILKTFSLALAIIASAKSLTSILRNRKLDLASTARSSLGPSSVRAALFPSVLPQLYSDLKRRFHDVPYVAELLSSPLLILLALSWRTQAAVYAATTALRHTGEGSRWRTKLPPGWTLNMVGNMWLLWAFVFQSKAFPKTYENVILGHSKCYVPADMSKSDLEQFLSTTKFSAGPSETPSDGSQARLTHHSPVCQKLHPEERSCLRNYIEAWLHESNRVWTWVGGFSALSAVLTKRRRLLQKPQEHFLQWLDSTVRGTVFVVGSINTAWGLVCLLQRVIPSGVLLRYRWLLNGALSSMWILVLPEKRRDEVAMYVARLALLSLWKAWRLNNGAAIPYGEVVLFGVSWAHLANLKRRGVHVGGLVGLGMDMIERR